MAPSADTISSSSTTRAFRFATDSLLSSRLASKFPPASLSPSETLLPENKPPSVTPVAPSSVSSPNSTPSLPPPSSARHVLSAVVASTLTQAPQTPRKTSEHTVTPVAPVTDSLFSNASAITTTTNQDRCTSSLVQTNLSDSQQPPSSSSRNRLSSKLAYALRLHRNLSKDSTRSVPNPASQSPTSEVHHTDASPPSSRSLDERGPRLPLDFSFLTAATILRAQRSSDVSNPSVSYIAHVDIDDFMTKRSKVGTSVSVYVSLRGTVLILAKGKNSTGQQHFDVRTTPVKVDVAARELRIFICVSGKNKVLRMAMPSEQIALKWKDGIQNALCSDIKEQYTFGKTIGSGAFGQVILAVHNLSKEHRAIKVINRANGSSKSREHLNSEIQVMKSISHPNIVHTYQIFDLKRSIYIVMEYVSGGDLFDFVAQHDSLTEKQSSETLRSIFRAVEYLHRNSIVHRDLKPENILCVNNSWPLQLKLTDFGFANFLDPCNEADDTMHTQVGTIYFMAPEIITNKGYGPAVDTWACGVLLYTILTGRLPFPGKNTTEYMRNVITGKPLFPSVLWRGISDDARSLIKGLLNPDPNKRLTALGALQHRWVAWPDAVYGKNEIKRDRSNLHSDRRQLFKARSAVIAVAMANKFRATIPHMVDTLGDSTKKVAGAIENGVKKTADGIEKGLGEIASGVVRIGDGIGEGTRKVAGDIGEGTKKMAGGIAEGTKKVAGGIGHGVKKTKDGVENGAKIVAGGIGKGVQHTAGGIGHGVKATGDRFKRSVELVVKDRNRVSESERIERNLSLTDSPTNSSNRPLAHAQMFNSIRRKNGVSRSADSANSQSLSLERSRPADDDGSSTDFVSAVEEHSETEDGWGCAHAGRDASRKRLDRNPSKSEASVTSAPSETNNINTSTIWDTNGAAPTRPKLPPLTGVTMGWSDEAMLGVPQGADIWHDEVAKGGLGGSKESNFGIGMMPGGSADLLRRTTALLMAARSGPPEGQTL